MKIRITYFQKELAKLIANSSAGFTVSTVVTAAINKCIPKNAGKGIRIMYYFGALVISAVIVNQLEKKSDELIDDEVEALNQLFEAIDDAKEPELEE